MAKKKQQWQLVEFPITPIYLGGITSDTLLALRDFTQKIEKDGLFKFDHYVFHDQLALLVTYVRDRLIGMTSNFALRVKPYLYGSHRDMHDPGCKVVVKADIAFTTSTWIATSSSQQFVKEGHPYLETARRCDVDLEAGVITQKGSPLKLQNTKEVIALIREIVGEEI